MGFPNDAVLSQPRRAAGAADVPPETDRRPVIPAQRQDRRPTGRGGPPTVVGRETKELAMGAEGGESAGSSSELWGLASRGMVFLWVGSVLWED